MLDKITHFLLKGLNEREKAARQKGFEVAAAHTPKQRHDDVKEGMFE